jgi:D-amino-acid oxidase
MPTADAVVVGAGVIGLTSAVSLAEQGLAVACWAAEPPQRTTSRVAGAVWGLTFPDPVERTVAWAKVSLAAFRGLAGEPDSGVRIATGVVASRRAAEPPWQMFPGVEARPRQRAREGYLSAFEVEVPLIDMPRYLSYLERRLETAAGAIEIHPVRELEEAVGAAPVVVNCTGLGARELVPDPSLQPVRGQHVVVENPGLEEFFIDDRFSPEWTSWFPHDRRVILGGVAQPGATEPEPDPAIAARILERCVALEPRLAQARVLEHQVGLRPGRETIRLEQQQLGAARCIHNYGHGGCGVSLSWGCAHEVQELVQRRA